MSVRPEHSIGFRSNACGEGTRLADIWNDTEIDLIVAESFALLADELGGEAFNKAEHSRALQDMIPRCRGWTLEGRVELTATSSLADL